MAEAPLEGHTLGQKHRSYNKLVKESITTKTNDALQGIDINENDVNNLIKVDTACANKDVDYILGVLKGNDMLYVSRVITQCPWLITDNTYAHIINPEFLNLQLFPLMMPKAINKLLLHIRLNLRDENRVESFFNYYENLDNETALKWLPHCSATFMETKAEKYAEKISPHLLKRLCEKSHRSLEAYVKNIESYGLRKHLQATMFLVNTHTEFYLDVVESTSEYNCPKFNSKMTKVVMKKCPERMQENFTKYANHIDLPTFVNFLNKNDIKDFLLKQVKMENKRYGSWIQFENVQHFVKRMPQEERMSYIKEISNCFKENDMEVDNYSESSKTESISDEKAELTKVYKILNRCGDTYNWYVLMPFEIVLTEVKEKIKTVDNENEKITLLRYLTRTVRRNLQSLEKLLQYYNDNHLKSADKDHRNRFAKNVLDHTNVLNYNSTCWYLLNNIFIAMNLYVEKSGDNVFDTNEQACIKAIIVHELLTNKEVPEVIMKQFAFTTLKEYRKNIDPDKRTLIFDYLYNHLTKKIQNENFENTAVYDDNVQLIKHMLKLLKDWEKNLGDYLYVLIKVKELIKVNKANSLKVNLSWIYDVNKTWRKCMFEESIILCASQRVCVNALKHDPGLLSRNEEVVSVMRSNDQISLKQLLTKMKVYWPNTFALEWSQAYREKFNQVSGHKALIRGLSILLPHRELLGIINKYKPKDAKINWEESDEVLISLRKNIAKNMHFARPQPTPGDILEYAKGDYLQFALPSLNAIFYNLCSAHCRELVPQLLNSPVSLQKHGIRIAFAKMQSGEIKRIFSEYWKTIKNLSIRAVTFKLTHNLLCKENNPDKAINVWGLLNVFIDGLTLEEDKTIYECLTEAPEAPVSVNHLYVMKAYTFLKRWISSLSESDQYKYKHDLDSLMHAINNRIESMEPEFVANILQEYYVAEYTENKSEGYIPKHKIMELMASYLTCVETEAVQIQRYQTTLLPLLKHTVTVWLEKGKNDIVRKNLDDLLRNLRNKLQYVINNNKIVPVAMYSEIQKQLEQSLKHNAAYMIRTEWKLTVAFAKLLNASKGSVGDAEHSWDAICSEVAPNFGKRCLDFLKKDIKTYFPSIDEYFTNALRTVLSMMDDKIRIEVFKHMLAEDLIQSYLVTIRLLPSSYYGHAGRGEGNEPVKEMHEKILAHPSIEVKMHFYHKNKEYRYKTAQM